jgi:hypothetical protein
MNGRYAMTAEKSDRIKFILESLKIALEKLEINISGITDLKNFKDEALRKVGEKILGLNPSGENINFTYDITSIDQTQYDILLKNLSSLSFSHAFKWTEDFVFCPSFTGFYYQFNFSPWDKPMTAGETIAEPELNQNIEESVEKILNSTKEENEEWDKDQKNLEEFCKNLKAECKKQNIPVFAKSEKLNRYFFGSFVPSGIFN